MPLITSPLRFRYGPEHPEDAQPAIVERRETVTYAALLVTGLFALTLFVQGILYGRGGIEVLASLISEGKTQPLYGFGAALVLAFSGLEVMHIFSGVPRGIYYKTTALVLVLAWPGVFFPKPGGLVAGAEIGIDPRAAWLSMVLSLSAFALLLRFLRESTVRGARLILPRWRSPTLETFVVTLSVVSAGILFVANIAAGAVSPDSIIVFGLLAMLAVPAQAFLIKRLGGILTGSAGVGAALGVAWAWGRLIHTGGTLMGREELAVLMLMSGLLGYFLRRPALWIPSLVLAGALRPEAAIGAAFFGAFVSGVYHDRRGAIIAWSAAILGTIIELQIFALFGSGEGIPLRNGGVWDGAAALAIQIGIPALAATALYPATLTLWLLPYLFARMMIPPQPPSGGFADLNSIYAALVFFGLLVALQRFCYGRTLRPTSETRARDIALATPQAPPADDSFFPPKSADEKDRDFMPVPSPWRIDQLLRVRAVVAGVLCLYAGELVTLILR